MRPPVGRAILGDCTRLAGTQHGVISREQALTLGLSPQSIKRLSAAGVWQRVLPRVYRLWIPSAPAGLWRQRLAGAALWLGPGSAVSHRASGALSGLDGIRRAPVELSTTTRRRPERRGIVVHHIRSLPSEPVVTIDGIPVTSVPRTIVDIAPILRPVDLELALDSAIRAGLTTSEELSDLLDRSRRTLPGKGRLHELLAERSEARAESALEVIVGRILLEAELPAPIPQYEIRDPEGRFVARVDFAYPYARLAIEADGYRYHSSPRDWRRDRARQNALSKLGWVVYRVTWHDATRRPKLAADDIASLLDARAPHAAPQLARALSPQRNR